MIRRALRIALLSLLTACSKPAPPPPPSFASARAFNPLEVCVTSNYGRYARSVVCRDTHLLFISRQLDAAALLAARRSSLTAQGISVEARSLLIGGREREALGYHMGEFESAPVAGLLLPLEYYGTGESIEAQCFHYNGPVDPKRCASLLDAFVSQGITRGEWPSVLAPRDPQEPHVFPMLGREVRLPAGCDVLGPLEMECKEGRVSLLIAPDDAQLTRALEADVALARQAPLVREWKAPCTVEGVTHSCSVSRHKVPYDELYIYRAALRVQNAPILLVCEARKSTSTRPPGSICSQFFEFAPEALAEPELPEEEAP